MKNERSNLVIKPFSKNEKLGVSVILLIIFIFTVFNLQISLRRSRDSQRRSDIGAISDALDKYQNDFGFFPPSTDDGKILACKGKNFGNIPDTIKEEDKRAYFFSTLRGCDWGDDGLKDVNDNSYSPYLKFIPKDPRADAGISYLYISDMNSYQLYSYLEGESSEIGFRLGIVNRNLKCGSKNCNFGKAFGETPLEKSLQEYENEITKNNEKKNK